MSGRSPRKTTEMSRVFEEIDTVISPIYKLGDESGVSVQNISKKYRGKPDNAAEVIFSMLSPFKSAKKLLDDMNKTISLLKEEIRVKDLTIESQEIRNDLGEKIDHVDAVASELNTHADTMRSYAHAVKNTSKELKSYAESLQNKDPLDSDNSNLLKVVKKTIQQSIKSSEDELKHRFNVIISGVPDMNDVDAATRSCQKIVNRVAVYALGLKGPKIVTACYFGRYIENSRDRPVCVTFDNVDAAEMVVKNAHALKSSLDIHHHKVYISPHRSLEEQKSHRELVKLLKMRIAEDSSRFWYIRDGEVKSRVFDETRSRHNSASSASSTSSTETK